MMLNGYTKLEEGSFILLMTPVVPGNDMRQMFTKVPFGLDFKIYLFNVTNPMDVQKGSKPKLQEVGPFCYSEWKEKIDISDNPKDDTMIYKPLDTFFKENWSGCLTGEEEVTILHPLMVGMVNTVSRTKPAMLSLISKAINAIYRKPTSIYLTAKATEILFDGVLIDCDVSEFAAKAVCTQLRQAPDLRHVSDTELAFSLIGPKNATPGKTFKIYRGQKKSRHLGMILEYDGKKQMDVWPTKECNKVGGTDGTIFPPFLKKEEGLESFSPDLCRSLVGRYSESTVYDGIPVWLYTASLGDMSKNADEKCFCPTNDTCLKKGMMDLFKCIGVPIYVSLPHFYDSDLSYLEGVEGLHPEKRLHGIEIYFEHMTGGPVSARKRLQFNMPLEPNSKIAIFKDLPTVVHPIFWVEEQTALRKRNEMRSIYLQIPFPLDFNIYFFNVTNPDEVTKGEKPILQEVGPYAYDEWVSKVDVVDDNAEDTLTYSPLSKFIYNENKTGKGFSQDDVVTVLHPVIVGAVITAAETSPALLPILAKAIKSIFRDPSTMYLTDKVRNILFDGMTINCSVSDFAGKAVCSQLKTQLPGLTEVEKNIFKFSLLGPRNATVGPRTKIKRGIKNSKDLGKLVEFDGKKELDLYDSKECNKFHGTDGWIFPPGLSEDEGIWTFSGDLCRNVQAKFVEPMPFKGLPTDYYEGDLGDQQNDPDEKCYCPTPKTCLRKGLYDLTKCMGVPIVASLPHFFKSDESLLDGVEGVHPNASVHSLAIIFERTLGTPVKAAKRIQFNFVIKPNPKVAVMNNVPEVVHPFLWLEESVELEGALLKKVQMVFVLKKANTYLRWVILLACLGGIGYSAFLYNQNKDKGTITPIHMINKLMGKENEVKEFNSEASSARSDASRRSDNGNYDNPAFISDRGLNNKTKF